MKTNYQHVFPTKITISKLRKKETSENGNFRRKNFSRFTNDQNDKQKLYQKKFRESHRNL